MNISKELAEVRLKMIKNSELPKKLEVGE